MDVGPHEEPPLAGRRIIQASWLGTAVFAVTAVLAAAIIGPVRYVAVAAALGLFGLGCIVFFWAYWTAVQRSRVNEIGIGGLFFAAGPTAPMRVKALLNGAVAAQVAIAFATAAARPYTTLAFGLLVPVLGIGCTGLWSARYGVFATRQHPEPTSEPASQRGAAAPVGRHPTAARRGRAAPSEPDPAGPGPEPDSRIGVDIGQNARHG